MKSTCNNYFYFYCHIIINQAYRYWLPLMLSESFDKKHVGETWLEKKECKLINQQNRVLTLEKEKQLHAKFNPRAPFGS